MVTEPVWNHPFDLLSQVNSKGFFSFDVTAYSTYTVSQPYTSSPVFDGI